MTLYLSAAKMDDEVGIYIDARGYISPAYQPVYEKTGRVIGIYNSFPHTSLLVGWKYDPGIQGLFSVPTQCITYGQGKKYSSNVSAYRLGVWMADTFEVHIISPSTLPSGLTPTSQNILAPDDYLGLPIPLPPKMSMGLFCKRCTNFYPYAESNQADNTLICWSCRH